MADFLLELFSEEIPARMQPAAAAQLKERFEALLNDAGLKADSIETHVTPRRLALLAHGLPPASEATEEERRGPKFDAPVQAIEGFLKSTGLTRDQLEERDTGKGVFLFAMITKEGQPTATILAERLPALITGFQWPKSQRWGAASTSTASPRWVRPLRGIIALLDRQVVPFEALGIQSGNETSGHRFMGGSDPIEIDSPASYKAQLNASFVILSVEERRRIIREGAQKAAAAAGLSLRPDDGLEAENAGLTEWPVPLLGWFDPAYLDVPPEVIQLTMRTNQKYFAVEDADGKLAPAFICVANLIARDNGATIIGGNQRVLSARLADARFFWEQDKKVPLETRAEALKGIIFHEKLGTMAEKVDRVAKLACWLVETHPTQFPGADPETVQRAARLAKADLTTGTVGEFPELQGIIGGYLAEVQGEAQEVVSSLRQQYLQVPEGIVAIVVALADRLDTLIVFFWADIRPSGSKDPYALRRAALSLISTILQYSLRIDLIDIFVKFSGTLHASELQKVCESHSKENRLCDFTNFLWSWNGDYSAQGQTLFFKLFDSGTSEDLNCHLALQKATTQAADMLDFFAERLKVQQRESGARHDLIESIFVQGTKFDLVGLLARVKALQSFIETEDGANLLAGYKRAANILRIEEKKDGTSYAFDPSIPLSHYADETEKALASLFVPAGGSNAPTLFDEADALFAREDFEGAMKLLATLRAPVDAFFTKVTVNDPDPAVRARRLGLLAAIRDATHKVADFSKIEG